MSSPRETLVSKLHFANAVEKADLLDATKTHDNLIAMLAVFVGQGYDLIITSVRSDHGDDSALGPHGHSAGYAVDVWLPLFCSSRFFDDAIYKNPYVTKLGLGGVFQTEYGAKRPRGIFNGTLVFDDNTQDHIHLQSAGLSGAGN